MTTTTPPVRTHTSRTGLWIALAALAAAAVVAALGVRAAATSYQRDQSIRNYHDARTAAVYYTTTGTDISASMRELQALDDQDVALMKQQRAALEAGNAATYNDLTTAANDRTTTQQNLRNRLKEFQAALAQAQHD